MTWIAGTAVSGTTPAGPALTVPVGVTTGMTALVIYARGDGTDWDPIPAKAGASFTLLDDRAATNLRVTLWSGTGLVAGDTITSSATVNGLANAWHVYTDEITYDTASLAAGIRGVSAATTTSGSTSVTSGQMVAVIGLERTTATGTVVSSVVSTGAETVTGRLFSEEASTVTSAYVGTFLASAAGSRSVTITHSAASTNGYAAVITTTSTTPVVPVVVDRIVQRTEVEFVPGSGVYHDISNRVESSSIGHPRTRPGLGGATTELHLVLQNDPVTTGEIGVLGGATSAHVGFSPFTPESPVGAYYPNIDQDRRVRMTAYWPGGGSAVRFQGWTDVWAPSAGDNPPATAMVEVTASCILSRYARRAVLSPLGEIATASDPDYEYLPFDDGADATYLRLVSTGVGTGVTRRAQVYQPQNKLPGSATLSSPDGGHITDGQVDFTRGDENAPAPVIALHLPTGQQLGSFQGWYRLTNDPAGSIVGDDAVTGFDAAGELLWVWGPKLIAGKVQWQLSDRDGIARSFFNTNAPREDAWHQWKVNFVSATATSIFTADKGEDSTQSRGFGSTTWTYDPRTAVYLSIGGRMYPTRKGKQTNTYQGTMSSLLFQYNAVGVTYVNRGNPGVVQPASTVLAATVLPSNSLDAQVGPIPANLTDLTPLMYSNGTGDLLSRWNEHVRSIGGTIYTRPDGVRQYRRAGDMFPATVSVTLDAEADLSAPDGGWAPVKDEQPTRVTVNTPLGSYEQIDAARETLIGQQLEGQSLDTTAGDEGGARSLAGLQLNASSSRLSSFGVDLTTSANNLVVAMMALLPYQRIRITNLNPAYQGITFMDVFASGWTETYIAEDSSYRFQFDTDPAEDYDAGRFDSSDSGRFAMGSGTSTVTSGTCVGNTGTGTVVVTGVPIRSTTIYPIDMDWNGERITVSAAGGSTSPQTLTVTARGVAPTVARAHVAGEPVEVYRPLRFGV